MTVKIAANTSIKLSKNSVSMLRGETEENRREGRIPIMNKGVTLRILLLPQRSCLQRSFSCRTRRSICPCGLVEETMPDKGIILGLDLQGGLHLVFEVQGDKAVEIQTDRIVLPCLRSSRRRRFRQR